MKKSLFAMFMAGCLLASCNNDEPNPNAGTGELETSYIAVSVNSANASTRAEDGGYEEGNTSEQKVSTAHFFFFDASGNPFNLNSASLVGANDKANYVVKEITDANNKLPNVETITNVVLTIQNLQGEYPTQMLVVLNWDYAGEAISLTNLRNTLADYSAAVENSKGFLMSNSAYVKGTNTVITATPITIDNIASSEAAAMSAPVQVFVERVAAKITLKENKDALEGTSANFDTGITGPDGKKIYARIVGWDVNTTLDRSYLVKEIDATWQNATLGFTWNDEPYYRSYWANSVAADGVNVKYDTDFTYAGLTNIVDRTDYCLENTGEKHTQVVIAAELMDELQHPVQVARLYSEMYTFDGIKNVIANALKDHYYYGDETTKHTILPEHIDFFVAGNSGKDSYTVKYRLTEEAAQLNWYYTVNAGSTFTPKTADEVNVYLSTLEGAQAWNGKAYYTVDIEHLGTNNIKGVVRNHSYVITVDGISGLGTPVYDPNTIVTEPVDPEETTSYVSARINVLSWKIVNQNVNLQ
ncbi:MAG: Mfa1 fimbrilin C-terminal domain-containing protein [Muribaculaceae bacterium]|nr:Mfa1 fimbrilin C-terminal domain-containing protein [Muribaculaceae bacterium]